MKKFLIFLTAATLFFGKIAFCATTSWQDSEQIDGISSASVRMLGSFYENEEKEKKLILAAHFKIADGWKIYGQDQSGFGLPPSFDFGGSSNVSSHEIFWPKAEKMEEKIGADLIQYNVYHNEVILPIAIQIKDPSNPNNIKAHLDFGLCKDICIPASMNFEFNISDEIDSEALEQIQPFFDQKISEKFAQKKVKKSDHLSTKTYLKALAVMLVFGFIGGAILNIMPCVLPVLSIKLISVINHSDSPIKRIRQAFFATIFGILFCFVVFAVAAAIIKLTSNSLGWGLQFQNPFFLIFLAIVLSFFAANMAGFFEISFDQFFVNFLNKKITDKEGKKNIFIPNFLSGILAVLLATPCSAPFLGAAISFALSQSFITIFLVFMAIGLGFALPYIILILSPKLVYLLPKPGIWMIKVKQLLALFLVATVIWLIYVLTNNIGLIPALIIAILIFLMVLSLKIKNIFLRVAAIAVAVSICFAAPKINQSNQEKTAEELKNQKLVWHEFNELEIHNQVALGHVVFIDVTADWCLTCKFNKTRVLNDKEFIDFLAENKVYAMRADITKPNMIVLNFLQRHNRYAIPFNAVFGPSAKDGLLTKEILTKTEVLELINQAK